eukprot:gene30863-44147_t
MRLWRGGASSMEGGAPPFTVAALTTWNLLAPVWAHRSFFPGVDVG